MITINDILLSRVCKSCKQPNLDFLRLKILKLDLKLVLKYYVAFRIMQLFPEFNYCIKILFCLFSVIF